jgi:hypothetical protein
MTFKKPLLNFTRLESFALLTALMIEPYSLLAFAPVFS